MNVVAGKLNYRKSNGGRDNLVDKTKEWANVLILIKCDRYILFADTFTITAAAAPSRLLLFVLLHSPLIRRGIKVMRGKEGEKLILN